MSRCGDGTLHVGHTDSLDERMRRHDAGTADSCTAARRPLILVFAQESERRCEALSMERKLRGWRRARKSADIAGDWNTSGKLAKGKHRHERFPDASTSRPAAAALGANGHHRSDRQR